VGIIRSSGNKNIDVANHLNLERSAIPAIWNIRAVEFSAVYGSFVTFAGAGSPR
jgi:hypothetical protein